MKIETHSRPGIRPAVLIADDQDAIVQALDMVLREQGMQTQAVNSPEAALAMIRTRRFDLFLMDMNFVRDTTSGFEGLELLAKIHALDDSLPVIAMTAWGNVEVAVEAMRRGAVDFIQKPWDNWRLIGTVRHHLRGKPEHGVIDRRDLQDAGEVQRQSLCARPRIPGLDIAVHWQPARELGGDYFDISQLDDHIVQLCIADVEGKGVAAALLMSNLLAAIKALASPAVETGTLCNRLNTIFCEGVNAERSVSLFYALFDTRTRKLRYTNAGHLPQFRTQERGQLERLGTADAVLGRLPRWTYSQAEIALEQGDSLILFTDGITEAQNELQEEFGEERLADCALHACAQPAADIHRGLMAEVVSHCRDCFEDDATLIVVKIG